MILPEEMMHPSHDVAERWLPMRAIKHVAALEQWEMGPFLVHLQAQHGYPPLEGPIDYGTLRRSHREAHNIGTGD